MPETLTKSAGPRTSSANGRAQPGVYLARARIKSRVLPSSHSRRTNAQLKSIVRIGLITCRAEWRTSACGAIDLGNREVDRPVGAVRHTVARFEMLKLGPQLFPAPLPDSEGETIEHVRRVPTSAVSRKAHLHDPRPDLFDRRVDRDGARRLPHRMRDELVPGQDGVRLLVGCSRTPADAMYQVGGWRPPPRPPTSVRPRWVAVGSDGRPARVRRAARGFACS